MGDCCHILVTFVYVCLYRPKRPSIRTIRFCVCVCVYESLSPVVPSIATHTSAKHKTHCWWHTHTHGKYMDNRCLSITHRHSTVPCLIIWPTIGLISVSFFILFFFFVVVARFPQFWGSLFFHFLYWYLHFEQFYPLISNSMNVNVSHRLIVIGLFFCWLCFVLLEDLYIHINN